MLHGNSSSSNLWMYRNLTVVWTQSNFCINPNLTVTQVNTRRYNLKGTYLMWSNSKQILKQGSILVDDLYRVCLWSATYFLQLSAFIISKFQSHVQFRLAYSEWKIDFQLSIITKFLKVDSCVSEWYHYFNKQSRLLHISEIDRCNIWIHIR